MSGTLRSQGAMASAESTESATRLIFTPPPKARTPADGYLQKHGTVLDADDGSFGGSWDSDERSYAVWSRRVDCCATTVHGAVQLYAHFWRVPYCARPSSLVFRLPCALTRQNTGYWVAGSVLARYPYDIYCKLTVHTTDVLVYDLQLSCTSETRCRAGERYYYRGSMLPCKGYTPLYARVSPRGSP